MLRPSANLSKSQFARNFILWGVLLLARLTALADQSVTLTWNPSSDINVAGYKIYYGVTSRVYTNSVTLGNVTNVTVSGLAEGTTYYFGATTLDAAGIESDFSNEATYDIPQAVTNPPPAVVNQPPTLDTIANLMVHQNAGVQTVLLTGLTTGSTDENQALSVSAVSSDPSIIPVPTVVYASPNSSGSLTFAPVADAAGTATVTVTIDDGGASNNLTSQTFAVTVVPAPVVNQPPTLDIITNLTIYQNAGSQSVALTGITSGSINENQALIVSAVSSDSNIITDLTVNYTSPNSSGTLTFAPVTNALGTVTVTVVIDDGGASNNLITQTFTVTVVPGPVVIVPPTMNSIADVTVNQNAAVQTITLTGISLGSTNRNKAPRISAASSNLRVVSQLTVKYSSTSSTGTLTFKPVTGALGTAVITVTINNGAVSNNLVRQSFAVTVARNTGGNTSSSVSANRAGFPQFSRRLTNNVAVVGHAVTLSVAATGNAPLKYQWKLNGINLAAQTKSSLTITNVSTKNAGVYSVTVSNNAGSTNSAPAQLVVYPTTAASLTSTTKANGQFGFTVSGVPGYKYVVQASSDLTKWVSVQTNTAPFNFSDSTANGASQRFYRAYYLP